AEDGIRHRNVTGVQTCAPPSFGCISNAQVCNTEHLPAMIIAYATESGNAELVAEELVKVVASHANATVIDLAAVEPDEIPVDTRSEERRVGTAWRSEG